MLKFTIYASTNEFLSVFSLTSISNRQIPSFFFFFGRMSKKETDPVEAFTKKILRGARGEEYLDLLLRDCVRDFPYREGLLFQQVIHSVLKN